MISQNAKTEVKILLAFLNLVSYWISVGALGIFLLFPSAAKLSGCIHVCITQDTCMHRDIVKIMTDAW